ncbi:MAG: radical SAM protein [Promethearchaeota archaeon]
MDSNLENMKNMDKNIAKSTEFPPYLSSKYKDNFLSFKEINDILKKQNILPQNIQNLLQFDFETYKSFRKRHYLQINKIIAKIVESNFLASLNIFIPGYEFPSLSVTGSDCQLNCEHCLKKYIHHMKDISTEEKLQSVFKKLVERNAEGCLISGGCTSEGKVPFLKFKATLKKLHKETNLIFNFHTGLISEEEVKQLKEIEPEVISFDFTLDEEIIKNIYHLNKSIEDYIKTFEYFKKYDLNVIPHITIGLNFGYVKKELDALKFLSKFRHDLIVFIILIPPNINSDIKSHKNNPFTKPNLEDIDAILSFARLLFPDIELSLGCMRPRGKENTEIEKIAVDCGINRLVIPSKDTLNYLKNKGYSIRKFKACCAIPLNAYKRKNKNNKDKDNKNT